MTTHSKLTHTRRLHACASLAVLAAAAVPSAAAADSSSAMVSCRPVLVKSTYGGRIAPNSHLALIRHGKVRTVNVHNGASAMVRFRNGSGRWLQSMSGARYAMANQPLSRDGRPGGAYVIASQTNTDRSVACAGTSELRARASDTASATADGSLPASGITETLLSASNSSGRGLVNYSPLEICSNQSTHPDGAEPTRHPAADVWCYKSRYDMGAYLNDPNGMERYSPAAGGGYIGEPQYRHFVNYNGGTVAAAKVPRIYPPTGKAVLNSPIVWRPVPAKVVSINGFGF